MQSQSSSVQLVAESAEGFLQRTPPRPWTKVKFIECKARPIGKLITVIKIIQSFKLYDVSQLMKMLLNPVTAFNTSAKQVGNQVDYLETEIPEFLFPNHSTK